MFSIIVITFEALSVLFIGIFARSTATVSTYYDLLESSLVLLLGFTLMYSPFRKFSIFSLVVLLMAISIAVQTDILFGTFWDSCFKGFASSFELSSVLLVKALYASLTVLLTCLDFVGLFDYWQVFMIIAPLMTIGSSLCSSILLYGLKVYDGGGGLTVFFYSGVCSLIIWIVSLRGKIPMNKYKIKESYINHTLAFIGLVISFISWPAFNMAGALVTVVNTIETIGALQISAQVNTFLGLSTAILVALLLASNDSKEQKMQARLYIDCFINGGIVIASYSDISLYPVIGMVLVLFTTVLTLIVNKYLITQSQSQAQVSFKFLMVKYSKIVYRIFLPLLGIIICSIVVATRSGQSPALFNGNYSYTAGMEIVAFLVVMGIATFFGFIIGLVINIFHQTKSKNSEQRFLESTQSCDESFFEGILEQIYPLHADSLHKAKPVETVNINEYTTRVIKESLLRSGENPLNSYTGVKRDFETKPEPLIINKNYSQGKLKREVSQMKVQGMAQPIVEKQESERQVQAPINQGKVLTVQHSQIKISNDQQIPMPVNRKLNFDDGSVILDEQINKIDIKE